MNESQYAPEETPGSQSEKGTARSCFSENQLKAWWSQSASLQAQALPMRYCTVRRGRLRSETSKMESWSDRSRQLVASGGRSMPIATRCESSVGCRYVENPGSFSSPAFRGLAGALTASANSGAN